MKQRVYFLGKQALPVALYHFLPTIGQAERVLKPVYSSINVLIGQIFCIAFIVSDVIGDKRHDAFVCICSTEPTDDTANVRVLIGWPAQQRLILKNSLGAKRLDFIGAANLGSHFVNFSPSLQYLILCK